MIRRGIQNNFQNVRWRIHFYCIAKLYYLKMHIILLLIGFSSLSSLKTQCYNWITFKVLLQWIMSSSTVIREHVIHTVHQLFSTNLLFSGNHLFYDHLEGFVNSKKSTPFPCISASYIHEKYWLWINYKTT